MPFPFERDGLALLDLAYESFGAARMLWGSDYPPVSGREGYTNALRLPHAHFAGNAESDRDLIFGGVARKVYRLG